MHTPLRSARLWLAIFASPRRRRMTRFCSILPQQVLRPAVMAVWGMAVCLLPTASVEAVDILDQKIGSFTAESKGSLTLNMRTGAAFVEIDLGIPPGVIVNTPWLNRLLSGSLD